VAPTFHIEHFGCRAARADGEAVSDRLRAAGHCPQQASEANLVIVNTCSVTAEADRAARAFIRRAHRLNPAAKIVVTGCYAQRAPDELAALAGVAAVIGNSHKALAPQIAQELMEPATPQAGAELVQIQSATMPERATSEQLAPPQAGSGLHETPAAQAASAPPQAGNGLHGILAAQAASASPQVAVQSATMPERATSEQLAPPQVELAPPQVELAPPQVELAPPQVELAPPQVELAPPQVELAPPQVVVWADERFAHSFLEEAQLVPGAQTRPNLKIQEGCGNRCSFCVIPFTRGPSKSLPHEVVLRQVQGFVATGGNELVLSGINLGRWGRDLPPAAAGAETTAPHTLPALLRLVFHETALPRLRLSSIEPMDWDDELIALMAQFGGSRLARHAHLPLQSGSDAVLRRMHRRYRPWHYQQKVAALLRAAGPELTLGADVMIGFPGETDAEFEETVAFIRSLPFGYLHLFPFSARPGTRAWALHAERPVPALVVDERMARLRALAAEKIRTHRSSTIGRELEAITLHTAPDLDRLGRTSAMTENFLAVEIEGRLQANRLVRLRMTHLNAEGILRATVASSRKAPDGPHVSSPGRIAGSI